MPPSLGKDVYRSVLRAFRRLENAAHNRFSRPHEQADSVLREISPAYNRFLLNRIKKSVNSVENLKALAGTRWGSIYGAHGKESLTCDLVTTGVEAEEPEDEEIDEVRNIPGYGSAPETVPELALTFTKCDPGDSSVPGGEVSIYLSLVDNANNEPSQLTGKVREAEVFFRNPEWKDWKICFKNDHTFQIETGGTWTFMREPSSTREVYSALREVALKASEEDLQSCFTVMKFIHFRAEQLETIATQEKENHQKTQDMLDKLRETSDGQEAAGLIKAISELWLQPPDQGLQFLFQAGSAALGRRIWVDALRHFNEAIERDPTVAEVWNRRAVANFEANRLDRSLWDIEQVLKREPRHFGAISGKANVYKFRREPEKELEALRDLLAIIPSDRTAKNRIEEIEQQMSGSSKTILDADAEEVVAVEETEPVAKPSPSKEEGIKDRIKANE